MKRNANALFAVLNNIDTLERAYQTAEGAAGSATREQENYAKSIQYSIDQAKASLQELAADVLSSETVKGFVDLFTKLVNLADEFVKYLDGVPKVFGSILGIFTSVKGIGLFDTRNGSQGLLSSIISQRQVNQYVNTIKDSLTSGTYNKSMLSGMFSNMPTEEIDLLDESIKQVGKSATVSGGQIATAFEKAGVPVSGLNKIARSLLGTFGNIAIGVALSVFINATIQLYQSLKNVNSEMSQLAEKTGREFKESKSSIENYKKEISELRDKLADNNISQSEAITIREKLLGIQDDLIAKYGNEASAINDITSAISGEIDALDRLSDREWREKINEYNNDEDLNFSDKFARKLWRRENNANTNYEAFINEMESSSVKFSTSNLSPEMREYLNSLEGVTATQIKNTNHDEIVVTGNNLKEIYDTLIDIQNETDSLDSSSASFINDLNKKVGEVNNTITENSDLYEEHVLRNYISGTGYEKSLQDIQNAYTKYQNAFKSGNEKWAESAKKDAVDTVSSFYSELDTQIANAQTDSDLARLRAIKDYAANLFKDLDTEYKKQQFDVDYSGINSRHNANSHQKDLYDSLSILESKDQIYTFNSDSATSEQREAYNELSKEAEKYGMSLDELIDKLAQVFNLDIPERTTENVRNVAAGLVKAKLNKGENASWKNGDTYISDFTAGLQKVSDEDFALAETFNDQDYVEVEQHYENIKRQQGDIISNEDAWAQATHEVAEGIRNTEVVQANLKEQIEQLENEYMREMDAIRSRSEKVGNVDIYKRPIIQNNDGSYSTTLTETTDRWVGDEETGSHILAVYTPILPDGTVLSREQLEAYFDKILQSDDPLGADSTENGGYGIVYNIETNISDEGLDSARESADEYSKELHNQQDKIYSDVAAKGKEIVDKQAEYARKIAKTSESSISKMVGTVYDNLRPELDALGDAYEKIFHDGKNADLSVVDVDLLQSLRQDLENTEDAAKQAFDPEIVEEFFNVLSNKKSSTNDVQKAFNKMATSAFDQANVAPDVNDTTFDSVVQVLSKLNIANADIVAFAAMLQNANVQMQAFGESGLSLNNIMAEFDAEGNVVLGTLNSMTGQFEQLNTTQSKELNGFIQAKVGADGYAQALALLKLQKILVNENWINESNSINQVLELAKAAGVATEAVTALANAQGRIATAQASLDLAIKSNDSQGIIRWGNELKNAQDAASVTAKQLKEDVADVSAEFKKYTTNTNGAGKATDKAADKMSDLSSELNKLESDYKDLVEIVNTYNETGEITMEQAQKIADMDFRSLASVTFDESGKAQLDAQAFGNLADAKLYELKVSMTRKAIDLISTFQDETTAAAYLGQQMLLTGMQSKIGAEACYEAMQTMNLGAQGMAAALQVIQGLTSGLALMENVSFGGFEMPEGGFGGGESNAAKEEEDERKKEIEEYKEKLEKDIDIQYKDWIEIKLEKLDKTFQKWVDSVDRLFSFWNKNWAINKSIQAGRTQIIAQESAYNYYKKFAKKAAEDAGRYIMDYNEKWGLEGEELSTENVKILGEMPLDKVYRKLVENGKMLVEEFNGHQIDPDDPEHNTLDGTKTLYEKIQAYEEW